KQSDCFIRIDGITLCMFDPFAYLVCRKVPIDSLQHPIVRMFETDHPLKVFRRAEQSWVGISVICGYDDQRIAVRFGESQSRCQCLVKGQLVVKKSTNVIRVCRPIHLASLHLQYETVWVFG